MKKLAARDFEDILQCIIPVIEGLLDEPHNTRLLKLLYRTAEWHAFAKLRMQSDVTILQLEELTKELGVLMRSFKNTTCAEIHTKELPGEVKTRARQASRKSKSLPNSNNDNSAPAPAPPVEASTKTLNMCTIKWHSLGDYVQTIRLFGPTDSYSTQVVCFYSESCYYVVNFVYRGSLPIGLSSANGV